MMLRKSLFTTIICTFSVFVFWIAFASQAALAQSAWDHYQKAIEFQKSGMNLHAAIDEMKKAVEKDKENAFYLSALGLLYFNVSDCPNAMSSLRKAIRINPDIFDAHTALGACLTMNNSYYEAIKEFNTALSLNPPDKTDIATIYNNLGQLNGLIGNMDESEKSLMKAIEADPSLVTSYINLGNLFSTQNKQKEAVEMYEKAISISPKYALAYNNLAFAYIGMGKYKDALVAMDEALRIEPDNQYFKDNRKNVELMAKEPEKYQDGKLKGLPKELVLKPKPGSPTSPESKTGTQAAVEPSTMVIASVPAEKTQTPPPEKKQTEPSPSHPASDASLPSSPKETAASEKTQQQPAKEQSVERKEKKESKQKKLERPEKTPEQIAAENYISAKYNLREGLLAEANKDINKAIAIFPENPEYIAAYGYVLLKRGDYDAAIQQFSKALSYNPGDSPSLTGLAYAQYLLGNPEEAEKNFTAAMAADPINGCAAANLAAFKISRNDCSDKTTDLYVRAIENKCSSGELHNNMALCSYLSGDQDEALRQAYNAAKLAPADPVIKENLNFLMKKSGDRVPVIKIEKKEPVPFEKVATSIKDIPLKSFEPVISLDFNDVFLNNWKERTILVMPFENPRGVRAWSSSPAEIYTSKVAKALDDTKYFKAIVPKGEPIYTFEEIMEPSRIKALAKKYGVDLVFVARLSRVNMSDETDSQFLGLSKKNFVKASTTMETVIIDTKTLLPIFSGEIEGTSKIKNVSNGEASYQQLKQAKDDVVDSYCFNLNSMILKHFDLVRYPVKDKIVKFVGTSTNHPSEYHW